MSNPVSAIASICDQRRQIARFNKPANRLELQFPPAGFTTAQLNMRRKAEILKYNGTQSNTKTNNLTKSQTFALLANNNRSQGLSQNFIANSNPAVPICPNDIARPTPTSSSDVPGPIIDLVYDPAVPLYLYSTNTTAFGIINTSSTDPWVVYTGNDIYFANGVAMDILYVNFTNLVNMGYYLYSFTTPVSIYVSGLNNTSSVNNVGDFTITGVSLGVYYSGNPVLLTPSPSISYQFTDLSLNTTGNTGVFNASQYVGVLSVTGIPLQVAPGFIYEFQLTFTVSNTGTSSTNITQLQTGVFCNISSTNLNTSVNCTPVTIPSTQPFSQTFTSPNYYGP